jgi:type IV secretory pathway VirB2 component (pilin)
MRFYSRSFFLFLALVTNILLFVSTASHAMGPSIAQDVIGGAINPETIPATLLKGSMSALLCGFRMLLCGQVALVIVATSIFVLGLMIMNRKLKWEYGILMITFIVLFTQPEAVVGAISHLDIFGFDLNLSFFSNVCTCKLAEKVDALEI